MAEKIDAATATSVGDLHVVGVDLVGRMSRITIDGVELKGVRDIKVSQSLAGLPVVYIELIANRITGIEE